MGFLDCRASAGFLTRYERELREPLVWRQGSQVPMRWLGPKFPDIPVSLEGNTKVHGTSSCEPLHPS